MRRRTRRPAARGFTLIELVVVVSVLAVVGGLGVGVFGVAADLAASAEARASRDQRVRLSLDRLERDLMEIASASTDDILVMAPGHLVLRTTSAELVDYRLELGALRRDGALLLDDVLSLAFTYFGRGGAIAGDPASLRRVAVRLELGTGEVIEAEAAVRAPSGFEDWREKEAGS